MAKVKVEAGKTIDSPRDLAKALLPKNASKAQVTELTKKIKTLNDLGKNSDITEASGEIRVGKINTVLDGEKVKLKDKSTTNKFNFVTATPQMPISFGSGSSSASPASAIAAYATQAAIPDYVLLKNEDIPIEFLSDLLLENIGGQEIIGITRNDLINGQNVSYQPIRNAQAIYQQYNPLNIISVNDTSKNFFDGFSINILDYVPNVGNGPAPDFPYAYVDQASGDLIVNTVNVSGNLKVEVQISRTARVFDDTIYGEEL